MRLRRETVEHPFGTMKARMGATHFLTKTLPKVAAEMALSVLAYNEHHRDQAADGCDRGLRLNRSWLLTDFPGRAFLHDQDPYPTSAAERTRFLTDLRGGLRPNRTITGATPAKR